MLILAEIASGLRCRVLALGTEGVRRRVNVPYLELRRLLERNSPHDLAQLDRLLTITKDLGPPFALGKAARITDSELYEIRTRRGTRLFWVYGPQQSVILLSGFRKQKWGLLHTELARARAWASALARSDLPALLAGARELSDAAALHAEAARAREGEVRVHGWREASLPR